MKAETLSTLNFAQRAYDDTEKVAEQLWGSAGFAMQDLRARGHSYSISDADDE